MLDFYKVFIPRKKIMHLLVIYIYIFCIYIRILFHANNLGAHHLISGLYTFTHKCMKLCRYKLHLKEKVCTIYILCIYKNIISYKHTLVWNSSYSDPFYLKKSLFGHHIFVTISLPLFLKAFFRFCYFLKLILPALHI